MDDIVAIKKKEIVTDDVKIIQEEEFLDESINTTLSAPEVRDLIADLNEPADNNIGSIDLTYFDEEFEHKSCEICKYQFKKVSNFYRHLRSKTHQLLEAVCFAQEFNTKMPDLSSIQIRQRTVQDHPIHMNSFRERSLKIENDPENQYKIIVENLKQEREDGGLADNTNVELKGIRKTFKCTHCLKNFSSKSNLLRHTKLHLPEDIFKCRYCPKTFKQKEYWKKHLYTHEKKKKFHHFCR